MLYPLSYERLCPIIYPQNRAATIDLARLARLAVEH
jgi:hypothetical protein